MATLKNPVLFSKHFGIDPKDLERLGVFDVTLNADTKLFIDPLLLKGSLHPEISGQAVACFDKHFGNVIKLLQNSKNPGDLPWRNAERLFEFSEPSETGLGYSDGTTHGSAIGPGLRAQLMTTAKEIVDLGIDDPELFALLGLLEDGIGADRISDMTTRAIAPALVAFNERICRALKLTTHQLTFLGTNGSLVSNPHEPGDATPVILVPSDILRELPIAHDWSDIASAASKNAQLRQDVNARIGNIWAIRTKQDKDFARTAALKSKEAFEAVMDAVGLSPRDAYDRAKDPAGHYVWREILATVAAIYPRTIAAPKTESVAELDRVVEEVIALFTDLIENKGLWKLLWENGKARHEHTSQRLFFAVAEAYCKANNLDLSPETDSGGGPVDFKFSSGYDARVLVEVKLSTNTRMVHGYMTQLEVYKAAESTTRAHFLVVDVGGMGKKFERIHKARSDSLSSGDPASEIHEVDGKKKPSASKR